MVGVSDFEGLYQPTHIILWYLCFLEGGLLPVTLPQRRAVTGACQVRVSFPVFSPKVMRQQSELSELLIALGLFLPFISQSLLNENATGTFTQGNNLKPAC